MDTQQTKANISQEQGSTFAGTSARRRLGIQFFPVAAFAVSCKPASTKPTAKHREGAGNSIAGTGYLDANVGRNTTAVPGNVCAPGQY